MEGMSIKVREMEPNSLRKLLESIVLTNIGLNHNNKLNLCIWGQPGVGKTSLVKNLKIEQNGSLVPVKVVTVCWL